MASRKRIVDEIADYLREHPDADPIQVARLFGVSSTTVERAMRIVEAERKALGGFKFDETQNKNVEVKKMARKSEEEFFEEEEEGEEEEGVDVSAIDPKILEFMNFLTSVIPLRKNKREQILRLLQQE
ncbi:hypothetical protein DRP04_15290, partial [Archaeoglobales archaeon]